MSYPDQEGPRNGMRPATFYRSCSGCKWHKHNLVKSGNDPIYRDDCTHVSAPQPPMKLSFTGNLNTDGNHNVEPGEWCPFDSVNAIDLV